MSEYKVKFYIDIKTNESPVLKYIGRLSEKEAAKILKYIDFLRENKGYLEEPLSKHIKGKIRELRVDFGKKRHRVFYFTFITKTPNSEIKKAEENYKNILKNPKVYE